MKYIMTEQQYNKLYLMRRLNVIDDLIDSRMDELYGSKKSHYFDICGYGADGAIEIISEWVVERMYYDYFGDLDDSSEKWSEVYHMIMDYVRRKHSDKITKLYNKICSNK